VRVRYSKRAEFEFIEAREWYDLGDAAKRKRFEEVVRSFDRILVAFPYLGRAVPGTTLRWLLLPGFPYRLVYRVRSDVQIVGFVHVRRDPRSWIGR
jgi:plasmid stabilization system protein ParE